jgi:hypothetical protein
MRRTIIATLLFSLGLGVQAGSGQRAVPQSGSEDAAPQPNAAPQRRIPCKTPENASMCYWTRGRLAFYNGNPSYRIWKVGTTRILGIYSGPDSQSIDVLDNEHPEFPANLSRVYEAEYKRNVAIGRDTPALIGPVFADFEVCALEPERPGQMQSSCIESARNIFVELSKRGYR